MGTKKCPQCAEEIREDAVKCRFCGSPVISPQWRSFALKYNNMNKQQRDKAWNNLTEDQRVTFSSVWDALGFNQQAVQPVVVKEGMGACSWIIVIALGIIVAIILISLG